VRYSVCGLLLCTACTRLATPQQAGSSPLPPTCVLQAFLKPIGFNSDDTRAAVRAFDQQTSAPYSALYIRKVPGRGEQASSCIRVVQQSATRFMRYTYRAQHVDSVRQGSVNWLGPFTQLQPGHYLGVCQTEGMDAAYWVVLVKQGPTVTFSLGLEGRQYEDLAAADQARIAPAFDLIRLMTH
jgi:hypothetical protein